RRPPVLPAEPDYLLVIDQLRDPGNLGTILRTAASAGVQGMLLTPGTTDAFAPKVVRAGMGAHFHLPIVEMSPAEIITYCKRDHQPGLGLYLAESGGGRACWEADFRRPLALVIGGEAEGAGEELRQAVDEPVTIPMPGQAESLNAAIAAAILIYEVVRQRSTSHR
ncbi:MAG TPA: RNA methyltransferase, partial [Anaerolineaceae bacterium]|nr:RNA methyltransferase [Anaerolineaceae bacterium]